MTLTREQWAAYGPDWKVTSLRIRTERARGRCECNGRCGNPNCPALARDDQRCTSINGQANPVTGSRVVLTVAHLNHTPGDDRDENLLAMCQMCHLWYDKPERRRRREAKQAAEG